MCDPRLGWNIQPGGVVEECRQFNVQRSTFKLKIHPSIARELEECRT